MSGYTRWVIGLCALGLSVGCENPSDVGEQAQDPPVARAVVLGHPFSPAEPPANGLIMVDARAGSDLLLSGKESDSDNAPILAYEWEPADSATGALVAAEDLIVRNNSTVLLKVPVVREETDLRFRLTVRDANGRTASAEVAVAVKPVQDPDRFLAFLGEPRRFFVYTRLGDAPTGEATARFRVEAERVVTYLDRSCPDQSCPLNTLSLGEPETIELEWPVGPGFGETACHPDHVANPVLTFDIPSLKVDDIAREIQRSGGGRDRLIELRDIDLATLSMQVTLTPLSGPDVELCPDIGLATPPVGNVTPSVPPSAPDLLGVQSSAGGDGISQTLSIDLTALADFARTSAPVLDSASSAAAYYNTVDPNGFRTTLSEWLFLNGFNSAAPDLGADAHAVYTNNFDLGFGRDMYVKLGACDDGVVAPGNCDVASVVLNYASLEAAAKKIGPIVAVAMEYSRPECPSGETSCPEGQRFTKFYVFAPDLRGDFVRISSVDLDGRGEKFVPQACVVCHGGKPAEVVAGVYGSNGDLNSGWLTWDLDSFLYSNTDPGFSRKAADAALRGQYTRDGQQEAFRLLNYYAWLTMYREDELGSEDTERYRRARELVEGWYGDAEGLQTSGTTWAEVVPDSWSDSVAAGASAIYTDVFAQHCRACHVLHIPLTSGQVPIGSYDEFVTSIRSGSAGALQSGTMPMARMTMDRFWVHSDGNDRSAGEILRGHLLTIVPPIPFEAPGTPRAQLGGLPEFVQLGGAYRLGLSVGEFVEEPWDWRLVTDDPAAELLFANTHAPVLIGISPRQPGALNFPYSYSVELLAGDGTVVESFPSHRSNTVPVIAGVGSRAVNANTTVEIPLTINAGLATGGSGFDGELVLSITNSNPSIATAELVCLPNGEDDCVQNVRVTTSDFALESTTITVTATDQDGDSEDVSFNVSIQPGLNVNDCSFVVAPREIGSAYTAANLNLLDGCIDADDVGALEFEWVSGPTLEHRACLQSGPCDTGTASVNTSNWTVQYTPPEGRITSFNGTQVGEPDLFSFRVRYSGGDWQEGTVTVDLRPSPGSFESFSSLRNALIAPGSCVSCHVSSGSGPAIFGENPEVGYCNIINGTDSLTGPNNSGNRYVDLASAGVDPPALPTYQSALYLKPTGSLGHSSTGAGLWSRILNWIRQGAYYTDGPSPVCP